MAQAIPEAVWHETRIGNLAVAARFPIEVIAILNGWNFHPVRPVTVLLDDSAVEATLGIVDPGTKLFVNLDSVRGVRTASSHVGEVRWFSTHDPHGMAGSLIDHFRGAYFRSESREVIYSGERSTESYRVPAGVEISEAIIAAVCVARESGATEAQVRSLIEGAGLNYIHKEGDHVAHH
jgi:hypothetical protein